MYYKKVHGEKYEPDWVPVSSTVIPLVERVVSVGAGARTKSSLGSDGHDGTEGVLGADESYKRAYVKHISKFTKIGTAGAEIQPGTLITDIQSINIQHLNQTASHRNQAETSAMEAKAASNTSHQCRKETLEPILRGHSGLLV
uniref:Uncharacterized protein n=1 Tax=Anopheles culicifacies TaxID=139723 RepID=A0A182M7Q5_9DIPT